MNAQNKITWLEEIQPEEAQLFRRIEVFLTPQRRALLAALSEGGELPQGRLAEAVGTTVSSLSNIIQKMEASSFDLLEVTRVGRYRCYKLSPVGQAYMQWASHRDASAQDGPGWGNGAKKLLQDAKKALEEFKRLEPEQWPVLLDNALICRTGHGQGVVDPDLEALVDQYLLCLQTLYLHGEKETFALAREALGHPIYVGRVDEYIALFKPFIPVLQQLDRIGSGMDEEYFTIVQLMRCAFEDGSMSEALPLLEALGLGQREYDAVTAVIPALRRCVEGRSRKEIYLYFTALFAGRRDLAMLAAEWVCRQL